MAQVGQRRAFGQGAGLVEQGDIDLGQPLERAAILHHQPAPRKRACCDDLRRRHGKAHRARAGDDQHRNGDHQRLVPAGPGDHPPGKSEKCQRMDCRCVYPRSPVGDADIVTARLARLVHKPGDIGKHGVRSGGGNAHLHRIAKVDRAGMDRVADMHAMRGAFAGQHGVIDRGSAVFDRTVRCQRLACGDEREHAWRKILRRDPAARAIVGQHDGAAAHPRKQRPDPGAGFAAHHRIKRTARQQEEQQHDCAIEIGMFAPGRGFIQAERDSQQHADGDRHVHVRAPVTQGHGCAGEKRAPGIGHHRQGDQGGKPVKEVTRDAACTRPDTDRQQHDVHHAEPGRGERPHQGLRFAVVLRPRIGRNRLGLEPDPGDRLYQCAFIEVWIVPHGNPPGREVHARMLHPGERAQSAFDLRYAAGTAHPGHREPAVFQLGRAGTGHESGRVHRNSAWSAQRVPSASIVSRTIHRPSGRAAGETNKPPSIGSSAIIVSSGRPSGRRMFAVRCA